MKPQMVIFAGPNGSGKSSVIKQTLENLQGDDKLLYLNADALEKHFAQNTFYDFSEVGLVIESEYLKNYLRQSSLINHKICKEKNIAVEAYLDLFQVFDNKLYFHESIQDSYAAAAIIDFLIDNFILLGISFSFETVMSHQGKNDIFLKAKANDFEVTLLFVTTDDPEINVSRVANRVAKGGHHVPKEKIIERYFRSLDNLSETLRIVDKAYLFDNSGKAPILIAQKEKNDSIDVIVDFPPNWYFTYVEDKFMIK